MSSVARDNRSNACRNVRSPAEPDDDCCDDCCCCEDCCWEDCCCDDCCCEPCDEAWLCLVICSIRCRNSSASRRNCSCCQRCSNACCFCFCCSANSCCLRASCS